MCNIYKEVYNPITTARTLAVSFHSTHHQALRHVDSFLDPPALKELPGAVPPAGRAAG